MPGCRRFLLTAGALVAAPAGGVDLDPCAEKPGQAEQGGCPAGTAVACWSPSAPWACWPEAEVPAWAERPVAGNAACRSMPTPPGSSVPYYAGGCTYLESTKAAPQPPVELMPWDQAFSLATETLAQLTRSEKHALMRGTGWTRPPNSWFELNKWWYVGNTAPIPRLNIPSLNLQDAAGGFRTYWNELVGTVTSWPSQLAMAATWDPDAVREFATAMGREFAGKGANGILGPSVNVHRVARNGRNFEYLSGEDPYLGSRLAEAYLDGVHSQGLLSVAKHWIFNDQETNRGWQTSTVDEKTAWELYYPPFQASVNAGVSAFMCSYNRIDSEFSCSNEKQLQTVKQKMGFRGFVQSDWWASHDTSLLQGMDQEMPGLGEQVYFSDERLSQQQEEHVDAAAKRILAVIHRMNLSSTTKCIPPACEPFFRQNVSTPEHVALTRTLAAESVVLLQNDKGFLPLSKSRVRSIAVVGAAAVAGAYNPNGAGQGQGGNWWQGDYYAGGGSGHVTAGRVVTPLEGIQRRAAAEGIEVLVSASDELGAALEVARRADVTVVVAATTSGESLDRVDLRLDGGADNLILALAEGGADLVVLVQAPGAVLMPWRNVVPAVLVMFLGGQETGSAWADVLFGDHAPSGRLPIAIPETEADTILPGSGDNVVYSEGLATSYRNKNFAAAFPFGHGLGYTTFEYLAPKGKPCSLGTDEPVQCAFIVSFVVNNTGTVAGRTVPQLYLEMPPEAGQPAAILKGFQKTSTILPSGSVEVRFFLTEQDLSYYDVGTKGWVMVNSAIAHIGQSSADIRHSLPFTLAPAAASSSYVYP